MSALPRITSLAIIALAAIAVPAMCQQFSRPIIGTLEGEVCGTEREGVRGRVTFIADLRTNCWFWQCLGTLLVPRRCPLGSAISDFYSAGSANPCSVVFNPNEVIKFDCTRKKFNPDRNPPCFTEFTENNRCQNGGTVAYEAGTCWCECPAEWSGDWDCSKRSGTTPSLPITFSPDDPCPFGIPSENFCASDPCQNSGTCTNQCLGPVCSCIAPFTSGKNCENFECTEGVECFNGGLCSRGDSDMDEIASCQCLPGFSGLMCELVLVE